ncbi:UV radiation resistance-associated gene protein [Maniola hyperantus]|uniref:UV radiation resistance-associated gene protein n=1 Tax=Aphantopus hyperantus TaxID=2795564 RepID=UPI003748F4E7
MFGRPRCREWTPLTTQQLRLRSLIQIVGYNIRPPEWCMHQCSYYLTLHHTTMSAPFYTSERICSPHPKWKEIDSEITQRMSSTNIVIRIWCHILLPPSKDDEEKPGLMQDTVIQTWGIYFSGLRYIGANLSLNFTSDCFKSNTLVFQMHGGYFCSYKSLKLDVIPPENELEQGSLSSDSSGKTSCFKITLESKLIQNYKLMKESRSVSPGRFSKIPEKEYSKSQSPVERGFKQNIPTLRNSSSLTTSLSHRERRDDNLSHRDESVERKKPDVNPNHIYEHSPDNIDIREFSSTELNCDISTSQEELSDKIDLSETAESYDLRNESDVPKYRYLAINFLKSEIRPSYNATKLQSLHLLQYSIKKRQEAVQEIKERIYQKSALSQSLSPEFEVKLKGKSRSYRNLFSPEEDEALRKEKSSSQSDLTVKNGRVREDRIPVPNGPRLTLKLNDLLSYKSKPSPFQRAEYLRLTKQLEILHFKRLILSDERDSKLANIRRLKEQHAKLFEENQDVGTELMQNYHALSRRTEQLKETRESCYALRESAARSHAALGSHRTNLLMDLHSIFYIEQKDPTIWSICDIPLPICGDDSPRASNPAPDSVAAGFVAQATSLAAAILNQPLRYKITLLGSASKILDIIPDLPDPNIPLFARGGDTTLFRYALFLLNKCIAQLLWGRGLSVYDMRPTLANLQRLLTTPSNLSDTSKLFGTYRWLEDSQCARTQSLRNLVPSERKYRQFNRFKECVDSHSSQKGFNRKHKHSRSVGSYHDDQDLSGLNDSTLSIMGSESNIYDMKLAKSDCSQNLKQHNSDSEITKIDSRLDSERVQFTLGDDTELDEKLVRLSSNNDDEVTCSTCLDENVKRICSEINSFCSDTTKSSFELPKSDIDIAKYMERKASVETSEVLDCENCDNVKCDLECANNIQDVIVIPSAEAILEIRDLEDDV